MGTMIGLFWVINIIAMVLLLRQKFDQPAWGAAVKFGLVIAVVGAGLGWLMTIPTSDQLAEMGRIQGPTPMIGAHSVGIADGGAGLPFVGWSTEGGDLRIGHFLGLHGLQVLPLIGWFIVQQGQQLTARRQNRLIWTAGLSYLGLIAVVTWQALRGESLIDPGQLTLITWGILIVATIVGALSALSPQTTQDN